MVSEKGCDSKTDCKKSIKRTVYLASTPTQVTLSELLFEQTKTQREQDGSQEGVHRDDRQDWRGKCQVYRRW